jgi:hypothetical protein
MLHTAHTPTPSLDPATPSLSCTVPEVQLALACPRVPCAATLRAQPAPPDVPLDRVDLHAARLAGCVRLGAGRAPTQLTLALAIREDRAPAASSGVAWRVAR